MIRVGLGSAVGFGVAAAAVGTVVAVETADIVAVEVAGIVVDMVSVEVAAADMMAAVSEYYYHFEHNN